MLSLYEQLLSSQIGKQSIQGILEEAQLIHINQFQAECQIGGDGCNTNCGPTSLAIGLHALGLRVNGENQLSNSGNAVDLARISMINDTSRDGLDSQGNRVEAEHSTFTDLDEIAHGAKTSGATAFTIPADSVSIRNALLRGAKVIISGTFTGKQPLPWTGDRSIDNDSAPGGASAHLVVVTDYDSTGKSFIVNDPARMTPIAVSSSNLEYFMQGNSGALAITK